VSGLRLFNVVVRTSASGPNWVTGGSYGVEASATTVVTILVGIVMVWKLPLAPLAQPGLPLPETEHRDSLSGIQP
jgi:hypothetical protein